MLSSKKIGFLGSGNMAEAIIHGLIKSGMTTGASISASDKNIKRLNSIVEEYGIEGYNKNFEVARRSDIVILAVKPQTIDPVLKDIKDELSSEKILVSIAAGIKVSKIADKLKNETKIVRVMPNTPAIVLSGVSAIYAGKNVSDCEKKIIMSLFEAIGKTVSIENEELMDAVTGLSGSGPAFVYTFIEALSDGGVKEGLSRKDALTLAAQTVLGSAKMVLEQDKHPAQLKDMVTSPGGTTIAGVAKLEEKGFRSSVISAVEAAVKRSKALGEK